MGFIKPRMHTTEQQLTASECAAVEENGHDDAAATVSDGADKGETANRGGEASTAPTSEADVDSTNTAIYIASLQWWTTDTDLEAMCQPYGKLVSLKFIEDRSNGKSKGVALIEFSNAVAAAKCKEQLHGKEINGRPCVVTFARDGFKSFSTYPRSAGPGPGRGYGGGGRMAGGGSYFGRGVGRGRGRFGGDVMEPGPGPGVMTGGIMGPGPMGLPMPGIAMPGMPGIPPMPMPAMPMPTMPAMPMVPGMEDMDMGYGGRQDDDYRDFKRARY